MGIDIEKFKEALEADLANPDGYWNRLKRKREAEEARFPQIESYIQKHGMKSVVNRMIAEHNEEWETKCRKRGYETYPNNKFSILWKWIEGTFEHVENVLIPQDFLNASYFVGGYWFTMYCGQGCFYRIYDNDLNIILQI